MNKRFFSLSVLLVAAAACDVDTVPSGLRATPPGTGPVVRFDTAHRPLPDIPLPNDFATFADPTSRTGLRLNASLIAPTHIEREARDGFSSMEGWGVSAPLNVAFDRPPGADPLEPAIDLQDVAARMQGDEHDLSNDPVYLVNLTTGVPMFVDVGNGYYPVVVRDPWRYMPNDPKAGESNLSFETTEEGAGLPQSAYEPRLDRDFDGVLDHPNTMPGLGKKGGQAGVDDLLTWYERETDTLILRPVIPLEEKTEYAVVLTDRLHGPDGQPVRSPFESIHHPSQRRGVARLGDVLSDQRLANYYGDLAGTGLAHVAFAWTFTTQPTHEDMRLLRDGLYGKGPFARFATDFPAEAQMAQLAGNAPAGEEQPPGWQTSSDLCKLRAKTPMIMKMNDPDIKESFTELFKEAFGLDKGDLAAATKATANIDHIAVGKFKTPFLLGDPASRDPDTRFHVDFKTGEGDVRSDEVQFFVAVPKANGRKTPFPVAFWGHGVTGHADELLFYAGDYARQGIAMVSFNQPSHGLTLTGSDRSLAIARLSLNCLSPFLGSFDNGRAHDLNGDGQPDSGWFWWTAHMFHTRDNVRQGTLDFMQLMRILRTFDGHVGTQDYNGDGKPDVAGDFDLDGVPDVGGPNVSYFAAGESLGGITSEIQGGIEPYVVASAPISGGGSLAADVGFRSYGVTEAVTGQIFGPVIVSLPSGERAALEGKSESTMGSRCAKDQNSVRIVVNEGDQNHELELACLGKADLAENMTVVVSNVTNGEVRCARTGPDGRFRTPIPSSAGDKLDIQIYNAPDVVKSYDGCDVLKDAPVGRRIKTFEQAAQWFTDVADPSTTKCEEPAGCQQFRDHFYPVGSDLVAPNEGLGLRRQSPSVRRLRDLAQAAFDPADPIVYAPYYMMKPLFDEAGNRVAPHALLSINTVGDNFVQVASGFNFARAAGAIPFLPPSALSRYPDYADYVTPQELYDRLGRRTPMQFLIDNWVVEGIWRLGRTHAGPTCSPNYQQDATVCISPMPGKNITGCANALYDADWVSEGNLPYDEPHPQVPLRLGRVSGLHVSDSTSLAAAWEPRLRGVPFSPDATAWSASQRVVAQLSHWLELQGKHTWDVGDTCKKWDYATYGNALMARFFASDGRDLYYLSHPKTHGCLVDGSCDFLR